MSRGSIQNVVFLQECQSLVFVVCLQCLGMQQLNGAMCYGLSLLHSFFLLPPSSVLSFVLCRCWTPILISAPFCNMYFLSHSLDELVSRVPNSPLSHSVMLREQELKCFQREVFLIKLVVLWIVIAISLDRPRSACCVFIQQLTVPSSSYLLRVRFNIQNLYAPSLWICRQFLFLRVRMCCVPSYWLNIPLVTLGALCTCSRFISSRLLSVAAAMHPRTTLSHSDLCVPFAFSWFFPNICLNG